MAEKKYDLFISYNKSDLRHAKRLATLIKNAGLKCWWQSEDSKQEYAAAIHEAIRSSRAFLVLLSHGSAASEWVGKEILDAIRLYTTDGLKILPIATEQLARADYDYFHHILGNFNWLFLQDYASDKELIDTVTAQLSIKIKDRSTNSIYSAEAEIEQERLLKQSRLYNLYANSCFDEIFAQLPSPTVLDVGSSDGENIMSRLEGRTFSHLLCIDKEAGKLRDATVKFGEDPRFHTLTADITRKAFADTLQEYLHQNGLQGFDVIHISAVLLHLKNPLSVLKMLREALSENGVILIQDEDDGFNMGYEEDTEDPTFFDDCFYIWKHSKESGDRHMGRKVPLLLQRAGYHRIEPRCTVITSTDFNGDYKEDLWDIYFNPKYWVVDSPDYFDKADAYEKCIEYEKKHPRKKQKFMKGQIFVTLGVPIYIARK